MKFSRKMQSLNLRRSSTILILVLLVSVCLVGAEDNAVAMQSSTPGGGYAGLAVDGNTNTYLYGWSCTHTIPAEQNPWWLMELEDWYLTKHIEITNRVDCLADRLNNFTIAISECIHGEGVTMCQPILCEEPLGSGETTSWSCPSDVCPENAKIQIYGDAGIFTLCEVREAVGRTTCFVPTVELKNTF